MGGQRKAVFWDSVYLIVLVAFGCVYLTVTGDWQIYTDPLRQAGSWCAVRFGWSEPEGQGMYAEKDSDDPAAGAENGLSDAESAEGIHAAIAADPLAGAEQSAEDGQAAGSTFAVENDGQAADAIIEEQDREVVYRTVEDDYFADALFIGDSRTVGMYEYGGLEEISTFYASTGLTVYKMFDAKVVNVPGQKQKITIEEALADRQFSKIYLMIGINEMGRGTVESFIEKYSECVAHLQELQPDAIIYLQGILKVTDDRSAKGDYITNEGIEARNEEIARLADDERIFYLDINPVVCEEDGGMVKSYTYDGVHLKAQYIAIWKDFLKTHAVQTD